MSDKKKCAHRRVQVPHVVLVEVVTTADGWVRRVVVIDESTEPAAGEPFTCGDCYATLSPDGPEAQRAALIARDQPWPGWEFGW